MIHSSLGINLFFQYTGPSCFSDTFIMTLVRLWMVNFDPITEYIDEGIDCIDANEDCIEIPVVYDLIESNDGIIIILSSSFYSSSDWIS